MRRLNLLAFCAALGVSLSPARKEKPRPETKSAAHDTPSRLRLRPRPVVKKTTDAPARMAAEEKRRRRRERNLRIAEKA